MATFNLTNVGAPIFASRSRINDESRKFGTFTATHSQTLLRRVVDGDPESAWFDEGGGDAVPSVLDFSFQFRTANISLASDLVILQNINWKRFKVEHSNAGAAGPFTIIPGLDFTGSDNTLTDIAVNPAEFTANFIRITITSAFGPASPNEKKKLGGIYVCSGILQPTRGMISNPRSDRAKVRTNEMGGGAKHRQFRLRSALSHKHYVSNPVFQLMPDSELATLKAIEEQGTTFAWFPEPGSRNRIVRTCQIDGAVRENYESANRTAGHRVRLRVDEVGRL